MERQAHPVTAYRGTGLTRRELAGLGLAAVGAHGRGAGPAGSSFAVRSLLGWLTDLDSRPSPTSPWPSIRLDEQTLREYERVFAVMRRIGFNQIVIWGLYVADDWPLDIASCLAPARTDLARRLIESAQSYGIRVLNGLGVYSWGYREIIRANPKLNGGNPKAMCASQPESWDWMRRILDFSFTALPFNGASMQSADLGRCRCSRCSRWSDNEYHTLINSRVADYVRSRWKDQVLAVSGWGMHFDDPRSQPQLIDLSKRIDYMIDVDGSSWRRNPSYRRKLIGSLKCHFGSLGGPQVEPPQHWERDRWFLPTVKHNASHLSSLFNDGGRACEYFFHILDNPGDELSLWVAGLRLSAPATSWEKHLRQSIEEIYQVSQPSLVDELCDAFLCAEDAYFTNSPEPGDGTLSLEPLIGDHPGPPVYLEKRLNARQRLAYAKALDGVREKFNRLAIALPESHRLQRALECIRKVQRDLQRHVRKHL